MNQSQQGHYPGLQSAEAKPDDEAKGSDDEDLTPAQSRRKAQNRAA